MRVWNITREGDCTLPGQLFQCSATFHGKFFLMSRWNLLCFSSVPLLLFLSLDSAGEFGTILLHLPWRYSYVLLRSLPSQSPLLEKSMSLLCGRCAVRLGRPCQWSCLWWSLAFCPSGKGLLSGWDSFSVLNHLRLPLQQFGAADKHSAHSSWEL